MKSIESFAISGSAIQCVFLFVFAPFAFLSATNAGHRFDGQPYRSIAVCNGTGFDHVAALKQISESFDKTRGTRIFEFEDGLDDDGQTTFYFVTFDDQLDTNCLKANPEFMKRAVAWKGQSRENMACNTGSHPDEISEKTKYFFSFMAAPDDEFCQYSVYSELLGLNYESVLQSLEKLRR